MEIQNFESQKNGPSLRMCENFRVPPLGGGPNRCSFTVNTGIRAA